MLDLSVTPSERINDKTSELVTQIMFNMLIALAKRAYEIQNQRSIGIIEERLEYISGHYGAQDDEYIYVHASRAREALAQISSVSAAPRHSPADGGGMALDQMTTTADTFVPQPVAKQTDAPKGTEQCVTGDTLLTIADGHTVPIVEIRSGDYVLSLNEATQEIEPHRVNGLLDMGVKPVYRLTTASGRSIRTTATHPYLVKIKNQKYKSKFKYKRCQVGEGERASRGGGDRCAATDSWKRLLPYTEVVLFEDE